MVRAVGSAAGERGSAVGTTVAAATAANTAIVAATAADTTAADAGAGADADACAVDATVASSHADTATPSPPPQAGKWPRSPGVTPDVAIPIPVEYGENPEKIPDVQLEDDEPVMETKGAVEVANLSSESEDDDRSETVPAEVSSDDDEAVRMAKARMAFCSRQERLSLTYSPAVGTAPRVHGLPADDDLQGHGAGQGGRHTCGNPPSANPEDRARILEALPNIPPNPDPTAANLADGLSNATSAPINDEEILVFGKRSQVLRTPPQNTSDGTPKRPLEATPPLPELN
ncbi:GM22497 [Drosophila sechellia]|uniref:GM22497 n=1 Tax=Drosophila sechellia TaxID=7238 RepID=B4IKU0_DROSE|nr:GM22497 [Drosophila sechellia]